MSKPTLEERVAVLEEAVMVLTNTDTKPVLPDFSNCSTPQQGSNDMLQQVLKTGKFTARHITNDGTRLPLDLQRIATSDPQEPYRLDTKPRTHAGHGVPGVWNTEFDPKASPKGIPFSVALEYMAIGRKASRFDGREEETFYIKDQRFCSSHGHTLLSEEDILAKDWWIVPEP